MNFNEIREVLMEKGLKVTPQRLAVLGAVIELGNHPSAENVIEFIKVNHPNIAVGTVYKTLETYVEQGIIKKVKSDRDIMRYDAVLDKHHHLHCIESDRIDDYYDDDLNKMIEEYFRKKEINNFKIKNIKLQIVGNFIN
ncbi:MAG: transcriptional repressor [Bacteroidales bacterium]|nr:transcriptional repressor [Bacteroidales bacterium]